MQRSAKQSRPQLVCVLADNSGSMYGPKAKAATEGIREMLLRCQTTGPHGADRSYYKLVLIQFGTQAEIEPRCNMAPVRQIDPESIEVRGNGGGTNITAALGLAYSGLRDYLASVVGPHEERSQHPLPVVLLFSDGQNGFGNPEPIADQIKSLNIDGEPVIIACAGVSTVESDEPDERLLRAIASEECYLHVNRVSLLSAFLAEVGSLGMSSAREVARVIQRLEHKRGIED